MIFQATREISAQAARAILACAVFLALAGATAAAEDRDFSEAMAVAAANLRGAEFYLRKKNTMMGGFELDAFQSEWTAITRKFAATPPEAYAKDPKWGATLESVTDNLNRARGAANKGDFGAARRGVIAMRAALAASRKRNGVVVFEDCVEEMRATFAKLYVYRRQPPDFKSSDRLERVKTVASVAERSFRRCYDRAPSAYRSDDMFERMFKESFVDFEMLSTAMDKGSTRDFVDHLRRIVSYLDLIFVRFG